MKSRIVLTLTIVILTSASVIHLLRVLNNLELTIGDYLVPDWMSIIGVIVPAVLVFHLNNMRSNL